jgi:hypothetical protein
MNPETVRMVVEIVHALAETAMVVVAILGFSGAFGRREG